MTKLTGKDDWGTPIDWVHYFERNYALTEFQIDACASEYNYKCANWFGKNQDMFRMQLNCPTFMNPIYSKKGWHHNKKTGEKWFIEKGTDDFVKFAHDQHFKHNSVIAVLLFANVSSSKYFKRYIGETPDIRASNQCELFFPPKRIEFENKSGNPVGTPSLSSMVVVYDKRFEI